MPQNSKFRLKVTFSVCPKGWKEPLLRPLGFQVMMLRSSCCALRFELICLVRVIDSQFLLLYSGTCRTCQERILSESHRFQKKVFILSKTWRSSSSKISTVRIGAGFTESFINSRRLRWLWVKDRASKVTNCQKRKLASRFKVLEVCS